MHGRAKNRINYTNELNVKRETDRKCERLEEKERKRKRESGEEIDCPELYRIFNLYVYIFVWGFIFRSTGSVFYT